ncbi:hypothetical protein GCM10009425_31770 [Pseudomonas asuensis]|uniref:histidine kinase n=1 Tax=Pseudomonas asuensis TaxID=1825787 RepID=A0ABQ2GZ11_9PSED|nr:PAS domain S-box protein [Pseudomonas asuensis]GGM18420.1 hypothetical protein GCM10009425_31770 [Pseudomonas asuensis]
MSDNGSSSIPALSRQALTELVFDHTADYAVIVTDPLGKIIAWNPSAEVILGWTAEEAVGQPYELFYTPDDRAAGQPIKEIEAALEQGRALDERWHIKRDGTIFWASGELSPLYKDGVLIGYTKILRDRTRERLTEESLRLAQKVGNIGTFELFPREGWIAVSPEFCRLWGVPIQSKLRVQTLMEHIHPEDRARLATDKAELPDDALEYIEYRIQRADTGEERWIARRGEPVHIEYSQTKRYLGVCYDVTERKRADISIRAAEARWRDLFEGMTEGFYLAEAIRDERGRMVSFRYQEANPSFWYQTGLDTSTVVLGRTVHELFPSIAEQRVKTYATLLETGRPQHFEVYAEQLGSRWFEARARRITVDSFAVLFMDITQRKGTEVALEKSESRFKAITHSIEQIVWDARPDGYRDFYNERWYEYTGMQKDSNTGFTWLDYVHPDELDRTKAAWQHSVVTGEPFRTEYRLRHHSGQYRWMLARAHPLLDADKRIVRWYGSSTDIQDIVEAREVLSRSQEELEGLVTERTRERDRIWHLSNDMMAVTRLNSEIVSINAACSRTLDLSENELLGQSFLDITHPEDKAKTRTELGRLSQGHSTADFEVRLRHRDGSYRLTSWTAVAEHAYVYAVGRDITEQRQTEEQLRQAQKMEAVGQLTGGIAHDFNNLLTGIIGSLDLMQRRFKAGRVENLDHYMDAAVTSAQRAAALTQRLLAFSRRQALDLKPVDINQLVASLEDLLHRTTGENITLTTHLGAGLCPACTDTNQLESALVNLVINARDAMPNGGTIDISTSSIHLNEDHGPEMDGLKAGDYIKLSIKDTGTGMTPDVQAKVFDPFFTTKPIGQGTGLGLSMVYGYIKQSKGHIRIISEPGKGTEVCLYLPCHKGAIDEAPIGTDTAISLGSGETVLVVEDEAVVRGLVIEVLKELGYEVLEAADSKSAIPILESHQRIDLMISDVGLPGLNGRQLAEIARQFRPELKVLFATGYAEGSYVKGYLGRGMALITKPFAIDTLAARIKEMLAAEF